MTPMPLPSHLKMSDADLDYWGDLYVNSPLDETVVPFRTFLFYSAERRREAIRKAEDDYLSMMFALTAMHQECLASSWPNSMELLGDIDSTTAELFESGRVSQRIRNFFDGIYARVAQYREDYGCEVPEL